MTASSQTQRGIDHIVLCVHDLVAAKARYEELGFTTTPIAVHPFGTSNSLVQLQGNFIELIAVTHPEKITPEQEDRFSFAQFIQHYLRQRQGMAMLVFASQDARADQQEFKRKGLTTYALFDFSRQAKLPDGSEVTVAFSLAFVTHPKMPNAAFFCCQQHAPEYFWKADYQRHTNGANAISEVIMVAEDAVDYREFFADLQAKDQVQVIDQALQVRTDYGQLSLLNDQQYHNRFANDPDQPITAGPHFAACQIAVDQLQLVQTQLDHTHIAYQQNDDKLQIAASETFGLALEFVTVD